MPCVRMRARASRCQLGEPRGDFLPGYEASAWYGIAAPKNTPSHILDKLNTEMNAGLALHTKAVLLSNGSELRRRNSMSRCSLIGRSDPQQHWFSKYRR
jgi:hypothetical protein